MIGGDRRPDHHDNRPEDQHRDTDLARPTESDFSFWRRCRQFIKLRRG